MQGTSTKDVDVQMIHRLFRITPGIDYKTCTALAAAMFLCQFPGFAHQAAQHRAVFRLYMQQALYVFFGDDQNMHRCCRPNVAECQQLIVFIDLLAWNFTFNDFTKNAITHTVSITLFSNFVSV